MILAGILGILLSLAFLLAPLLPRSAPPAPRAEPRVLECPRCGGTEYEPGTPRHLRYDYRTSCPQQVSIEHLCKHCGGAGYLRRCRGEQS
jgi:hypothetical protein